MKNKSSERDFFTGREIDKLGKSCRQDRPVWEIEMGFLTQFKWSGERNAVGTKMQLGEFINV